MVSALLAVRHNNKGTTERTLKNLVKTNEGTLKKWQNPALISNPIWSPKFFFQGFYLDNVPSYHLIQFPETLMN